MKIKTIILEIKTNCVLTWILSTNPRNRETVGMTLLYFPIHGRLQEWF